MASRVARCCGKERDNLLFSGHRLGILGDQLEEYVCLETSSVSANMLKEFLCDFSSLRLWGVGAEQRNLSRAEGREYSNYLQVPEVWGMGPFPGESSGKLLLGKPNKQASK